MLSCILSCVFHLGVGILREFHTERNAYKHKSTLFLKYVAHSGVPRGGFGVFEPPPPEIPKALQNRAKLNPIVKTVKNC